MTMPTNPASSAQLEIDRLNSDRLDLALMVYRLIRRMRAAREGRGHAAGDEALAAKALDYLQRKGLQASPLRADAGPNVRAKPDLKAAGRKGSV